MVDYSKWNKFNDYEDEEEEEEERDQRTPIVHKFDDSKRIRIGPEGSIVEDIPSIQQLDRNTTTTTNTNNKTSIKDISSPISTSSVATTTTTQQQQGKKNKNTNQQQYHTDSHSWEQSRHEVVIWISIPLNIKKSSELKVEINQKQLKISTKSNNVLFLKEMKYEVDEHQIDILLVDLMVQMLVVN